MLSSDLPSVLCLRSHFVGAGLAGPGWPGSIRKSLARERAGFGHSDECCPDFSDSDEFCTDQNK